MSQLSFFDEKRGVVVCDCEWGQWWQTVHELHLKVNLPPNTKAKQIQLHVKPKHISLTVQGHLIFQGELAHTVVADETVWTIEDDHLCVVLTNAKVMGEQLWEALLADGTYTAPVLTLHEMRKNLDLEKFQIEHPGFDFSKAKLSKAYDKMPGWSNDRLSELKQKAGIEDANDG